MWNIGRRQNIMAKRITININDDEQKMLEKVVQMYDCSIASLIKNFAFEKIEDEYDVSVLREFEKREAEGKSKVRPAKEFFAECGM